MKPLHDKRVENRKAMADAMQAPTIDKAKIEALRQEQMKVSDASSKRFTQALTDAGDVLSAQQRQAFFKKLERPRRSPRTSRQAWLSDIGGAAA